MRSYEAWVRHFWHLEEESSKHTWACGLPAWEEGRL